MFFLLLKIIRENLNLVINYDKTNLTVFVLSLWDKYRWDLNSFGQYIFLTYFISTFLFQFTQIVHKLLYVLIIYIRCWNLYSFVYHCFVILLELITILKDRGSAWSGLELWFRVASWHIGLDHMQLHCNSSY